jgi:hypothetical protein
MTDLMELGKKLLDLDTTQQSIQKASEEIIHISKTEEDRIEDIVKLWKNYTLNKTNKLPYLYLANDIIQNSFFYGLKLHAVMFEQLNEVLPKVYLTGGNKLKKEITRLLEIWEERQIYDLDKLANLKGLLNNTNEFNLHNPLLINYLIANKIKVNPKLVEFSKNFDELGKISHYTASLKKEIDEGRENLKEELQSTLQQENKVRENMLRDAADFIKKESLVYSKHVHYLMEVDKLLDKINSYKKLNNSNSMQMD